MDAYRKLLQRLKNQLEGKLQTINAVLANMEHNKLQAALEYDLEPLGDTGVFYDLDKMYDTLVKGGSKTRDFLILKAYNLEDT